MRRRSCWAASCAAPWVTGTRDAVQQGRRLGGGVGRVPCSRGGALPSPPQFAHEDERSSTMAESLRSSGVGDLRSPRVDHTPNITKGQANAIPKAADQETIRPMEEMAEDATTASAEGDPTPPVTSNGALGRYRNLIAPPGFQVP
jgi:hypothetical protein